MTCARLLALFALLAIGACAPDARGPGIDVDAALAHVAALATSPRPGDSDRARAAAAYIESKVPGIERLPVGKVHVPEITVLGTTHRRARVATTTDPNLIVRFGPRAGAALLVMAHYDTVAASPGAIDNAAAVGTLIELARVLAKEPPVRPVILAFTANEEIGLVGAEALADRGDAIEIAIALDLIGGSGDLVLNGASDLIGLAEMRWLAGAADRAGVIVRGPLAHRVVSRWWPQAERSDHGPFTRRGVRAVHLYHRGHDGERIDLAYHRPQDVPSRVLPASVDELGRLLRALIAEPLPPHAGDGLWVPIATNTAVPRWWLVGFCIVLASGAIALLVTWRRPRGPGKLGLLAGIACFALATGATVGIEVLLADQYPDHPAPWLHAPLRWLVGELLVLGGLLGLATRLLARFAPWCGERRYLALAAIPPLLIGSAWLVGGAAELAWIWLLPAALVALAPRLARWGALAILSLLLPVAIVLGPDQVREAAWNGFMPLTLPFAVWIATLSFPIFAGGGWYLRTRGRSGPLGTFILPLGCLLAMIVGIVLVSTHEPACSAARFHDFHLGCELASEVR